MESLLTIFLVIPNAHIRKRVITQFTDKLQVRIMQTSETATHMGATSQQFKTTLL
jgi:hypothetical protein